MMRIQAQLSFWTLLSISMHFYQYYYLLENEEFLWCHGSSGFQMIWTFLFMKMLSSSMFIEKKNSNSGREKKQATSQFDCLVSMYLTQFVLPRSLLLITFSLVRRTTSENGLGIQDSSLYAMVFPQLLFYFYTLKKMYLCGKVHCYQKSVSF